MDWQVLGIEPTKDKKTIAMAYRLKLRQTNPEDKPEEFKALRAAYEAAMALADQEDAEPVPDESPVGRWIEAVANLYGDYASRINLECWKPLLTSDVCCGLDTRPGAEEALLKFLLENYFMPQAVWKLLDETFGFSQRKEELYEVWPREFIDHAVLAGMRLQPALAYELFTPGVNAMDCDTYRRLYFKASQIPLKDVGPILEQIHGLSEHHPYGELLRYQYFIECGQTQEGKDGISRLAAEYPDCPLLLLAWAEICQEDGNTEEAEKIAAHILEIAPEYIGAKVVYAKCLASKQQYHEAKKIAYEILHASGNNPELCEQMAQLMGAWNERLIREREERYAENPNDADNAIELCWCYAQNERVEEALALAAKIDPACDDGFAYHNLMGKLYHNTGKFSEALEHLLAVEEILRNLSEDGTDETQKRRARLPEMLQFQGNCLMKLGRSREAKEKFAEVLVLAPEDLEVLATMGKLLFASGEYSEAVEVFQRLLEISSGEWVAEMLMAMCLYRLRRDIEAFDAVNRAITIQNSNLLLYALKMQILVRNQFYDEVHEVLKFLKETNAPEHISIEFIRAELLQLEKKDTKGALRQYHAIRKRVESGEDLMWTTELYYHIADLTATEQNISGEETRKTVLEIIDKGLSYNEYDDDLLSYKAWVFKKGGLEQEAIVIYQKILQKNPNSVTALRGLADLYFENYWENAAEALFYYEKLLEFQKTAELYYNAANCKRILGDPEGARCYYLKELEINEDDLEAYQGLAHLAAAKGDYRESLDLLDQALSITEKYGQFNSCIVEDKARILRRLGRYEDALNFVQEAVKRYHFDSSLILEFDICCQFGLWDRAKQVLNRRKRVESADPLWVEGNVRLNLLQEKLFVASLFLCVPKYKQYFEQLQDVWLQDLRVQMADLEGRYDRMVQVLNRRLKRDSQDDLAMLNLAYAYWQMGKTDAAKGAAQRALALQDNMLRGNVTDAARYRSRRSLALAILGRTEEARAELAHTRKSPLCDACVYGSCKDADIYEALIEEILGNKELAKKLYAAGRKKWPDDLDFIAGEIRMKKK